jgi:hypothetical protein
MVTEVVHKYIITRSRCHKHNAESYTYAFTTVICVQPKEAARWSIQVLLTADSSCGSSPAPYIYACELLVSDRVAEVAGV